MIRQKNIIAALFPHIENFADVNAGNGYDGGSAALADRNRWVTPDGGNMGQAMGSGREMVQSDEPAPPPASPQWQDISIGEESPTVATGSPISTYSPNVNPNSVGTKRKLSWEERNPDFKYPYPVQEGVELTPLQSQKNALAQLTYKQSHLQNEDHGVKGTLKEVLSNFFEGLKEAKPGMGLWESLALGGAGAGAGAINRTWNEQRQLDKLIPEAERGVALEQKNADAESDRDYRAAQVGELRRRPEKEATDRQAKMDLEAQKQLNRLATKAAERAAKGLDTRYGTSKDGSGRVVIVDGNGKEEFVTTADGDFEYNLLEKPEASQIEDGVNPDGTKKYKTVYAKGAQVLSNDSATKYREGMLSLGQQRLKETIRSNQVKEKLSADKLKVAQDQFSQTINLRKQAMMEQATARQSGDAQRAVSADNEVKRIDAMLLKMQQAAEEAKKSGELDDEQYDSIIKGIKDLQ